MVSRHYPWVGMVALLALIIGTGASAVRMPVDNGPRPGPHAWEVQTVPEPIEAVANGYVSKTTGAMVSLANQNAGPFDGPAEQVARTYLQQHASAFALSRSGQDLLVDQIQEAPGGIHVRMRQAVNGVPVWGTDIVVSLDETGRYVQSISSCYDPILAQGSVVTSPVLDAAGAEQIARQAVGITADAALIGEPPATALWILRQEDRSGSSARLAWRTSLPVENPMGDWEVFVDAASGSVLRITDQMKYTDGTGNAFDPDPLTTAQASYGATGYLDNNDADSPQLSAELKERTLRDLTLLGGLYYLRGPWVYLDDFEAPTIAPPTSADPNGFHFTRSQDGFENVNAYFHIDEDQRYMQSLGFNTIQHAPIHVDAHGLSGQDNSHYIPSSNRIAWGDGGVDDAEDTDVLLHEYGHAIQNSIVPGWGSSTQAQSMGEGFGDYWAGSYSASISSFHDYWVFNWDGHNPYWAGRLLNGTLGYSNLNGDIYHDGSIWASCWWLIRAEIGRTVSDTDMLKMHFYLPASAGMQQAAQQAMQADRNLYGGLHAGTLDNYFTLRGFFTAAQYDVPALTSTPLPDQDNLGPYPVTVTVTSTSAIVTDGVRVRFGTGTAFDQEVILQPTGNPNEWGGAIPGQGSDLDIRYYFVATNAAGWPGTAPRGAEYQHYQFHVNFIDPAAVGDGAAKHELVFRAANPNPFPALTALRFDLPRAENVRMLVHDVSGRTLRTLVDANLPAGNHSTVWDGKDESGHALPSGLYFVRLSTTEKTLTQKVLLAR
jgi:zinc metalloprotease ZmpB